MAGFAPCFAGSFTCSFASCSTSPPAACQAQPATGDSRESPSRGSPCAARGRSGGGRRKVFLYIIGDNKLETLTEKASSDHGVDPSMSAFLLGSVYPQALSGLLNGDRTEDEGRSQLAEDLGKEYDKLVGNNVEIVFSTWKKIRKIPDPEGRQPGGAP